MFSGIVEEVGTISGVTDTGEGRRLRIGGKIVPGDLKPGDSVSVSGTCLTVVDFDKGSFAVEATHQTLRSTRLGSLKAGDKVNLERALKFSDRLGGHLVTGHVDGIAQVVAVKREGFSRLITFAVDDKLSPFFVEKGSVAVDGVSLTVAGLGGKRQEHSGKAGEFLFTVALIPHTMAVTTLGRLSVGDTVNIETDLIAKYVARLLSPEVVKKINKGGLSLSLLAEHGYT